MGEPFAAWTMIDRKTGVGVTRSTAIADPSGTPAPGPLSGFAHFRVAEGQQMLDTAAGRSNTERAGDKRWTGQCASQTTRAARNRHYTPIQKYTRPPRNRNGCCRARTQTVRNRIDGLETL